MRSAIKILLAITLLLWAAAIVFPLINYRLGFGGGVTASMAAIFAVIACYRSEDVVQTRGGPVYKKDSKIGYLIPHLVLGFIFTGFMLFFVLACLFGTQ